MSWLSSQVFRASPTVKCRPAFVASLLPGRLFLAVIGALLVVAAVPAARAAPRPTPSQTREKAKAKARARADARAEGKARAKARAKEKTEARARVAAAALAGGKVAVFTFKGVDTAHVQTQVVHLLKAKGLNVTTTLRPVDSAEQYRDMAALLGLAVYVHGQIKDTAQDRSVATVLIRSGVTGRQVAAARFSGDRRKLREDVEETLWTRVGPAFTRACLAAAKPRRRHNAPMRIEAGTPIEPTPVEAEEGT